MARVPGTTPGKITGEAKAGPFAVTYYCERRDPDFDRKALGVLVVYKQLRMCVDADGNLVAEPTDGEGRVARTHACDERPGTRALAATGEGRPPVPGGDAGGGTSPHRRDRERARLGTLSLLAAIDLLTGVAVPMAGDTHKSSDLVALLRRPDGSYPKGDVTGPVPDDHSSHVSAETQAHPDTVPGRLALVLAPTHGSWPDLAGPLFGKLARQMPGGIRVSSKRELEERILPCFDEADEVPVPHRRTWGLDDIDLGAEDVDAIPLEVADRKACRPEDRGKRAPEPPRRRRRAKASA